MIKVNQDLTREILMHLKDSYSKRFRYKYIDCDNLKNEIWEAYTMKTVEPHFRIKRLYSFVIDI